MNNLEVQKILPCPFCGNKKCKVTGKRRGCYSREGTNYQVLCTRCKARGGLVQEDITFAIRKWNTREVEI